MIIRSNHGSCLLLRVEYDYKLLFRFVLNINKGLVSYSSSKSHFSMSNHDFNEECFSYVESDLTGDP